MKLYIKIIQTGTSCKYPHFLHLRYLTCTYDRNVLKHETVVKQIRNSFFRRQKVFMALVLHGRE
jgi:hypothetical protein